MWSLCILVTIPVISSTSITVHCVAWLGFASPAYARSFLRDQYTRLNVLINMHGIIFIVAQNVYIIMELNIVIPILRVSHEFPWHCLLIFGSVLGIYRTSIHRFPKSTGICNTIQYTHPESPEYVQTDSYNWYHNNLFKLNKRWYI